MPNVFVFSGHGDESPIPYENRVKVPEGVTLVTFAECMRVTKGGDLNSVLLALKKLDISILEEPVKNQDLLWKAFGGRHIHVHPPGSPLPPLYYFSRANHYIYDGEGEGAHDGMIYNTSGVYKVPEFEMPVQPEWKISDDKTRILHPKSGLNLPLRGKEYLLYTKLAKTVVNGTDPMFDIDTEVAMSMYTGAVWPDPTTIARHAAASTYAEQSAAWTPIQRVFKDLGPGVYYWPICRGDSTEMPELETKAKVTRAKSAQRRRETHGKGRSRKHRKTRRHRK